MSAQLVEALRAVLGYADLCDMPAAQEACQKARAAIAAAEAPTVAQPVAWLYWHPRDDTYDGPDTARKIAVSRFTDDTRRAMSLDGWLFEPLYRAAPPQPAAMTDEQIDSVVEAQGISGTPMVVWMHREAARACIAKFCRINGIGGKA